MSELDVIAPASRTLTLGGREVSVSPLKVRQLPVVLRAVRPILGALSERLDMDSIIGAYVENAEGVNQALAVLSDMTASEIDELSLDDAIELLGAAIEVNRDFFTRTLPRLLAGVVSNSGGSGPTP